MALWNACQQATAKPVSQRPALRGIAVAAISCAAVSISCVEISRAAEPTADDSGWHYRVSPYLWAPSLTGSFTAERDQPQAESDGYNLLQALEFGVLVAGEARNGDFFLLGEINYIKLADDRVTIRDRLTSSAKASVDVFETSLATGHRVHSADAFSVDLFGGLRYWRIDSEVGFTVSGPFGQNPSQHFAGTKSWLDPLIGARIAAPLGDNWELGLLANVGGFGIGSKLQWEVVGQAGYQFNERWGLSGGYRHVTVDFADDDFLVDATLSGPFLSLDITF